MTRHRFLRFALHPVAISCVVALLLAAANFVPRAQVGLPVFFSPDSNRIPPCNGALEFGWPNTARVDEFIQYTDIAPSPHYSLSHLLGTQEVYVHKTHQSALAIAWNTAFCVALVLLAALGMRTIANRNLSLKSMFLFVTLIGVLCGSFACGDSVSKSDHLAESLRWYTAEKWPAAFPE
jgi:hypothetical protein